MSNDFKIVGENNEIGEKSKNKNKKTILIIIFCLLLLSSGVALFLANKNKVPDDYGLYQQKAQIYEEQGIEYSYEDYKQDEKAIEAKEKENSKNDKEDENSNNDENVEITNNVSSSSLITSNENVSEATKQLLNKSEDFLEQIEEDTMVDTTLQGVSISIIKQTKEMNQFIDNHLGYPDSEYGSEYSESKIYMDDLVKSLYGKANPNTMYGMSLSQMQAEVRYSIAENMQYNIGNGYTQYNEILKKWTAMGHPILNSIETISLSTPNNEKIYDDTYLCNLIATIVSGGVKYKVYLSSQIFDTEYSYYKILDIEKI